MTIEAPLAIVLDAAPLGLLTRRPGHKRGDACKAWYASIIATGGLFFVPEIADYGLSGMVVPTENVSHLHALAASALWSDILP